MSFSVASPRHVRVAPAPSPTSTSAPTTPTLAPEDGSNMPVPDPLLIRHTHSSSTASILISIPSPCHVHGIAKKYEIRDKDSPHHDDGGTPMTPIKVNIPLSQHLSVDESPHPKPDNSISQTTLFVPLVARPHIFHTVNQSSTQYSTSHFISRITYLLTPTLLLLIICCGLIPLGESPLSYPDSQSFIASLSLSEHYHLVISCTLCVIAGGPTFLLAGASAVNQYHLVTWKHIIYATILVSAGYIATACIILGSQAAFPLWVLLPYSTLYPTGWLSGVLLLRDIRPSNSRNWSLYHAFWFRYTAVVIAFPACVLYLALFFSAPSDGTRIALLIFFSLFQYVMRDTIRYLMPNTTSIMMRVLSPFWVTLVSELVVTVSFPHVHDISTFALVAVLQLCTHVAHPLTFTPWFFKHKQRLKKAINFQGQYGWNQPYDDYLLRTCNDYFFTLLAQFIAHVLFIITIPCMRYGYSSDHWPFVESMMPSYNFRVALYFGAIQCVSCIFQIMFAQYWIRRVWHIDVIALASYCLHQDGLLFALACCTSGPILMAIVVADFDVLFYFVPWK